MKKVQANVQHFFQNRFFFFCILTGGWLIIQAGQPVYGQDRMNKEVRPYELDWAKRFKDDHAPLVDFENMDGWFLESAGGTAKLDRSKEQVVWDKYTAQIVYQGSPDGASFVLRPPKPILISGSFTAVNLWVWNNYWIWKGDRYKPRAILSLLLETSGGQSYEIPFSRDLDWPEWYLLHVRLSSAQREAFAHGGILKGIRLSNCLLSEESTIYLDNLSFYMESYKPVKCEIQPRPGVDLAPGQTLGVHTGKERLPFPTREKTMLPLNLDSQYHTELVQDGKAYIFRYQGADGILEYCYEPKRGNLGDITIQWKGSAQANVRPMDGGGVRLATDNDVEGLLDRFGAYLPKESKALDPEKFELIECKMSGETVIARWNVALGERTAEVEYVFRLWQKSLVADVHCIGGQVGEVSLGAVRGGVNSRLITVPYWTGEDIGEDKGRPAVLVMGSSDKPLFLTVFPDYYRTGASRFYFRNGIDGDVATCTGGTYYLPKTNGQRNDCHERIFLTFSPRFEEILPTVDNPPSVWRNVAAEYLILNHGASNDRNKDYEHWKLAARYGMRKLVMMDHETGWRDAAESFTFRTVPAPGKGGDVGQLVYSQKIQSLGLRYGLYNNYTDLVPVNAFWNEDLVIRLPDGSWETAWFRCYAPKTQRTVSMEQTITSAIQKKFNVNAGCLDVHTAITPWMRVDYDERVPGAGTMMSQFYDFGQLMLHQQQVWHGPVFSEGGNHYYYCGLITGSNGEDRGYELSGEPWLVDFDLLKLHPLGCDVGFVREKTANNEDLDRFLAGTIAYGHVGKFFDFGSKMTTMPIRSYYMLQQLQSSYAKALVKEIRYADENGKLLDVSTAIATDVYRRSQLRVEYDNDLVVWVNGNKEKNWKIPNADIPPNGYYASDPKGNLIVFSALMDGSRVDFVHSPAYDYVDGRGKWIETSWAASDGQLIVLRNKENHTIEVIPFEAKSFAIALGKAPVSVMALDMEGKDLGPARVELRKGMYYLDVVENAVSYMFKL